MTINENADAFCKTTYWVNKQSSNSGSKIFLTIFLLINSDDSDGGIELTLNSVLKLLAAEDDVELVILDCKRDNTSDWKATANNLNISKTQVRESVRRCMHIERVNYIYEDYFRSELISELVDLSVGEYFVLVYAGSEFDQKGINFIRENRGSDLIVTGLGPTFRNMLDGGCHYENMTVEEYGDIFRYKLINGSKNIATLSLIASRMPSESLIFGRTKRSEFNIRPIGGEGYSGTQKLFLSLICSNSTLCVSNLQFAVASKDAYQRSMKYIAWEGRDFYNALRPISESAKLLIACSEAAGALIISFTKNNFDVKSSVAFVKEYFSNSFEYQWIINADGILRWLVIRVMRFVATGFIASVGKEVKCALEEVTVSLVTSVFNAEEYLPSFLSNLVNQSRNSSVEWVAVDSQRHAVVTAVIELISSADDFPLCQHIHLDRDPGIYECWNIGIKKCQGQYVGNFNLDDRKFDWHTADLIDLLDKYPDCSVASTGCYVTEDIKIIADPLLSEPSSYHQYEMWFCEDWEKEYDIRGEVDLVKLKNEDELEYPYNFLHCMPIWRKALHDTYGFFNEEKFGTYADYAFWLSVASKGEKFIHHMRPGYIYFVDQQSHNRRFASSFHFSEISRLYFSDYKLDSYKRIQIDSSTEHELIFDSNAKVARETIRKIRPFNLGSQLKANYGSHRSGWAYALQALGGLHNEDGLVLESFIEKKFVWGTDDGEWCGLKPRPYLNDWVGFIHVPPNVPRWFMSNQSNFQVLSSPLFRKSIPSCRGLFCLSDYHRRFLRTLINVPISVTFHPTEIPKRQFDIEEYYGNPKKRLIQVGWWLRKLNAINFVQTDLKKTLLGVEDYWKSILSIRERCVYNLSFEALSNDVELMGFVNNEEYDELLCKNIVFVDFYDTSANNLVIECIARGTPIVVPKHPAVVEYLGKDYPLYFSDYTEISKLTKDFGQLANAAAYLKQPEIRWRISNEAFLSGILNSEVMNSIKS
jgi:glycosyltransferase involved in cell wall biosynthesis